MKKEDWLIEDFDGKLICLRGVGKMFYQHGFPIAMSIIELQKKGIEVSLFHVADECMKPAPKGGNWSPETTYKKLKEELEGEHTNITKEQLKEFCFASYENQREMIFNYLFSSKDKALEVVGKKILVNHLAEHLREQGEEVIVNPKYKLL